MNEQTKRKKSRQPSNRVVLHPSDAGVTVERNGIPGANWESSLQYECPLGADENEWYAWEALRRNVSYQEAFRKHISSEFADWGEEGDGTEWGIENLKDFRESYSPALKETRPRWLPQKPIRLIDFASAREVRRLGGSAPVLKKPTSGQRRQMVLNAGEVAVVFNLEQISLYRSMLRAQLDNAFNDLEKIASKLHMEGEADDITVGKRHLKTIPKLLRLSDAMLAEEKPTNKVLAETLFGNFSPEKLGTKIKEARELIYGKGYLGLLVRTPKVN